MTPPANFSVIVPIYDPPDVGTNMRGLLEKASSGTSLEVILVDNDECGNPAVQAVADAYPGCRYVHEPKPGAYRARNAGIRCSTGRIIALTDADCTPDQDWPEAAESVIRDGADVVIGQIRLSLPRGRRPSAVELFEERFSFRQWETAEKGFGTTANLVVTRAALDRAGLFREDSFSGGDVEWCKRAGATGLQLVYCPDAVVSHPPRSTLGQLLRKGRRVAGGQVALAGVSPAMAEYLSAASSLRYLMPPLGQLQELWQARSELGLMQTLAVASVATINKANMTFWRTFYRLGFSRRLPRA